MQEQEIEEKQRYLRREIQERGYDTTEFTIWIDGLDGKGAPRCEQAASWENGAHQNSKKQ